MKELLQGEYINQRIIIKKKPSQLAVNEILIGKQHFIDKINDRLPKHT